MAEQRDNRTIVYVAIPLLISLLFGLSPLPERYLNNLKVANPLTNDVQPVLRAISLYSAASYFPWRGDLWEKTGDQYLASGNAAEAIQAFEKASALKELSLIGELNLGDAYFQKDDVDEAIKTWQRLLENKALSAEVYPRLLHAYVLIQDFDASMQLVQSWNGWKKQSAVDIYGIGLYQSLVNPQKALSTLSMAGFLDPDLQPNIRTITTAINSSRSDDPMAYQLLLIGQGLAAIDKWQLAEQAFSKAASLSPDYAEAWAFLSEAQEQIGLDGKESLQKALNLKPDSILIQAMQGIYWENHGRPDLAIIYLHKIAEQEPQNGIWQVELGNAMVKLGDLVKALYYYQQAVVLEPDNASYWRALAGYSLTYNDQINQVGLPAARQAVALDPANPSGLDILGQYLLLSNDLFSAERMFEKALQFDPTFVLAHYHLGMTFLDQGKKDSAYQELLKASNMAEGQPLDEQIKRVLAEYYP